MTNGAKPASTGGDRLIELTGAIDEDFSLSIDGPVGVLVLDVSDVERVSSIGVREWMRALAKLEVNELYFVGARPAVVSQFNMVQGFSAGGVLVSLALPYACDDCDLEYEVRVDLRDYYAALVSGDLPDCACPGCGQPGEFDDTPGVYLSFVSSHPPPVVSARAAALIDGESAETSADEMRVQKDLTDGLAALWLQGSLERGVRRAVSDLEGDVVVLLGGVTSIDDRAAADLIKLIDAPDATVWFARLPTGLDLLPSLAGAMRGHVCSLRIGAECPSCLRRADELVSHGELGAESFTLSCLGCGHGFSVELSAAHRALLGAPPPVVTRYLETHAGLVLRPRTSGDASQLFGRYRIIRQLGQGGMARVFLAQQRGPGGFVKRVALKRVLAENPKPELAQMLLREARLAGSISHPNVVQIFDIVEQDGAFFIAMEFVPGWDLHQLLRASRELAEPMPIGVACRIASETAAGLHAAHSAVDEEGRTLAIVHRDVSPRNVLLAEDGQVKVTDFGVSQPASAAPSKLVQGTPAYMAPEQIDDDFGPTDARADVFALGVLLYEMLAGFSPFRRDDTYDTISAVVSEDPPPLPEDRTPGALRGVIGRAMQRRPSDRFASAAEMRAALKEALVGVEAPTTGGAVSDYAQSVMERAIEGGLLTAPLVTPTALRSRSATLPSTERIKKRDRSD